MIRSGASLEEVQGFVDDALALQQSPMAEEGESSTGRETLSRRSPTQCDTAGYRVSNIEQSLRAHRDLLGNINASIDLPNHLARQLDLLLSHVSSSSQST